MKDLIKNYQDAVNADNAGSTDDTKAAVSAAEQALLTFDLSTVSDGTEA